MPSGRLGKEATGWVVSRTARPSACLVEGQLKGDGLHGNPCHRLLLRPDAAPQFVGGQTVLDSQDAATMGSLLASFSTGGFPAKAMEKRVWL